MNILIVENQQTQFESLCRHFSHERYLTVYPSKKEYVAFIDHVRVWVNGKNEKEYGGYAEDYRDIAIEHIQKVIEDKAIELIVMDHKLGAASTCLTGIDLAEKINDLRRKEEKSVIPVIFLSKTPESEKTRMDSYSKYNEEYPNSCWVHKGYIDSGLQVDDAFFKAYVLPKVEEFKSVSKKQILINQIEILLNKEFWSDEFSQGVKVEMKQFHFQLKKCDDLSKLIQEEWIEPFITLLRQHSMDETVTFSLESERDLLGNIFEFNQNNKQGFFWEFLKKILDKLL